mgnify:CR=1 FL=1
MWQIFPSIIIKILDGCEVENPNEQCLYKFVKTASNSLKPVILKDVKHYLWAETKSKKPLANFINHDFLYKDTYEGKDLTSIYDIVMKELGL